jgi:hypothetical protein
MPAPSRRLSVSNLEATAEWAHLVEYITRLRADWTESALRATSFDEKERYVGMIDGVQKILDQVKEWEHAKDKE